MLDKIIVPVLTVVVLFYGYYCWLKAGDIKAKIAIKITGKDEFKNLDIDLVSRFIIFLIMIVISLFLFFWIESLL